MADLKDQIEKLGAEIVVAVPEGPSEARKLRETLDTPFTIWSADSGSVHERYGLGRALLGMIQRSGTVAIDADGMVRYLQIATDPRQSLATSILLEELEVLSAAED